MKTAKTIVLLTFLVAVLRNMAAAQPADTKENIPPAETAPATESNTSQPASEQTAVATSPVSVPEPSQAAGTERDNKLRLNFRGVPLDMVLNYLSDAAGFIIDMETDVNGKKVDVWSNQPLDKGEAVNLLNTILNQNGFAAIRNGRILKIVSREDAKKHDIPVVPNLPTNGPSSIPKTDEMITQIIPVRYANVTQMTKDLQPLLPSYASLTANESANALVLTDTQSDVRRMAQIVTALDTSISSISAVRVFPLKYADAKDLATAVKDLFESPTQQQNNNPAARFFARFRGGGPGGPGGFGGSGDQADGTGNSEARTAASRVVAVADERSNSLVVSAPDEYIPTIEHLVSELDVSVADVTELRVFHLKNADPAELADQFATLFPDTTKTSDQNNQQGRFRFFRGGGNQNTQTSTSDRTKKMSQVIAVADPRTSSLIVSAASELMPQIAEMVFQLDASSARKQKVFVYSLENADAEQVQQILQDMFSRNSTANRNSSTQNSALTNRKLNNNQNTGTSSATGNTGFGNNRGTGGTGTGF